MKLPKSMSKVHKIRRYFCSKRKRALSVRCAGDFIAVAPRPTLSQLTYLRFIVDCKGQLWISWRHSVHHESGHPLDHPPLLWNDLGLNKSSALLMKARRFQAMPGTCLAIWPGSGSTATETWRGSRTVKRAPPARRAVFGRDRPTLRFDQSLANGQAQAAVARRQTRRSIKLIEHTVDVCGGIPGPRSATDRMN